MAADVVEQYFHAVNTEDWELMRGLWHADAELRVVGRSEPRRGVPAILEHFPLILRGYAEHRDTPTRVLHADPLVLVEIHFAGRTRKGRAVEFDALDVFEVDGGRIRRLQTWYDTAHVAEQVRGRSA